MRKIIIICFIFISCNVFAFQHQTVKHRVQEGETIENIAKKYRVTPYDIIKLNPDARKGLEVNSILVIKSASGIQKPDIKTQGKDTREEQREPYGFIRHKVRKRETLFGLSQKYQVTQEEIKRYNRELYSVKLRKGMRLQIPKYRNPVPPKDNIVSTIDSLDIYTVQPKETRWSIAHKYGISVDSLHTLNPIMKEVIKVGEQLRLPSVPKDSISINAFKEHTVLPQQTLYSLTKELNVTKEELEALNPTLKQVGLQSGMVLKIPNAEVQKKLVNADNYVFYEVKPREGFFRLKVKLDATKEELETWNPILKEKGLIAGMVLKLPKDRSLGFDVRNSVVIEKFNLLDSIKTNSRLNVAFVLPFRLKNVNFDSLSKTKKHIQMDNAIMYATDIYSGALMALDSVKKLGISVNVKTFDSGANRNAIKRIVESYDFSSTQAIIGPIYPDAFNELSMLLSEKKIPQFSPLTNSKIRSEENIFHTVPKEESLRELMIRYIKNKKGDSKIFIIADEKNEAVKERLLVTFPEAEVIMPFEDLFIKMDGIQPLLSSDHENWVVVETNSQPLLANITSVLNSVNTKRSKVKLFTTHKSKIYDSENISNVYLSRLNFHYPQTDGIAEESNSFIKNYKAKYGYAPSRYATRGFDITYDILLKLAYDADFYSVSRKIGETTYVENKFSYDKDFFTGYYNTSGHIIMYDNMEIKEVPLED